MGSDYHVCGQITVDANDWHSTRLELHRLRELVKQSRDGIRRALYALSHEGRNDMTLVDVEILVADLRKLLGGES